VTEQCASARVRKELGLDDSDPSHPEEFAPGERNAPSWRIELAAFLSLHGGKCVKVNMIVQVKHHTYMPTNKLTKEIITAAIEGFEGQKLRLDAQIAELRQILDGQPTETAAVSVATSRKRKVSAAARKRMAMGQKARWAKLRGESGLSVVATPEPPKRKMSAARKAALLANLKKARVAKAAKKKAA
jgi:hypothetical protein